MCIKKLSLYTRSAGFESPDRHWVNRLPAQESMRYSEGREGECAEREVDVPHLHLIAMLAVPASLKSIQHLSASGP